MTSTKLSLQSRKVLERALLLDLIASEDLEEILSGEGDLLAVFTRRGIHLDVIKEFFRENLGDSFWEPTENELSFFVDGIAEVRDGYLLFSAGPNELGAVTHRFPYDPLVHQLESETEVEELILPILVLPEVYEKLLELYRQKKRSIFTAQHGTEEEEEEKGEEEKKEEKNIWQEEKLKLVEDIDELPLIDEHLAKVFPKYTAQKLKVVPLYTDQRFVYAITPNPQNFFVADTVNMAFRRPVKLIPTTERVFEQVYERIYENKPLLSEEIGLKGTQEEEEDGTPGESSDDTEARKFVYKMAKEALHMEASDIHLEPSAREVLVRFRIDGLLRPWSQISKVGYAPVASVIKLMSGMDIGERRLPQDGKFRLRLSPGRNVEFRVSTVPTPYGERIVMRQLKRGSDIPDLANLGFLPDTLERFKGLIEKPYGLILVTGPTGSGKSFTLFASLKHLVSPDRNILTVEDPIEYEIPGISQIQVKPNIGLTFARVLRSFLRQDPDVIMVGEIRDAETTKIAVEAALTGHLVLATLHTNNATQAVMRLEEMGVERYNVAATLLGVLAQRLGRKLCECKRPLSENEKRLYEPLYEEAGLSFQVDGPLYGPGGCRKCGGTGYRGRIPFHELMVLTDALREATLRSSSAIALRETAIGEGMRTLRADGLAKAGLGLTSVQEVLQKTLD